MDDITENAIQELMQHPDIKDMPNSREIAIEVLNRYTESLDKKLMDGEPKQEPIGIMGNE